MIETIQQVKQTTNKAYKFEEIGDKRWGIYFQDRLLATVGSYEACQSMGQLLSKNSSHMDSLKAMVAFKKSINKSLIIK